MAQNLDELTLKIEADASEANAALDGLIGKLGELSKALTQVKGNTKINVTTKQVQSLSHSVDNSSRAATRFGSAFRKSFSTLGNYTKTVAKFGLTVGKGMFIGTPTAMAKGMMALGKGTASAVSGFAKLVTGARNTKERFDDLLTTVGSLVIKFTVLKKIFGTLWGATEKAMNFIETFHYFDRSFDKIGEDSVNGWAQAGYDSAEAYANSFKDRALELTRKMSGFNIDHKTGEATSTGQVNLGLDPNMLLNYQAQFGQMANGLGMTSEAALQTSKALTMLGADWSALRNIGFEESYTKMASALAGQTRAVRSLGVDISMATLQQYAYNAGLTTSVSKLDGAAKAELRMIAILDQSRVAWGDMATTLNTPANQYRLLTQNVNTLARAIGNIFLPVVQKVLPYINGLVIALQRLFVWLGKFLGIKSEGGGATGGMSDAFADIADDGFDAADGVDALANAADDANDALGNAADTAEKLKNTILAFDELNVLNSPNESSTTGTGGSGKSGKGNTGSTGMSPGDMGLLDNALSSLMDEYEAAWNAALDGLSNKAQEIADKIVAAFTSKDWNGLGKTIADLLWKGIKAIGEFFEPDFINPYIEEITTGIAGTINGFFDPSNPLWTDLGWSIANVLNAGIRFANELYDKTLFDNIGHSLGISFLGLVKDFDAYGLGRLMMQKFSAAVSILEGFLEEMQGQWDLVGYKVEQFILGAMSMINPYQIANVINLAVEGATDFLGGIGWENLGTEIGTKLEKLILNVDPHKIAGLISMAFRSALQLAKGFLEEMKDTWDGLGEKVGTLLAKAMKGIPTGDLEQVVSDSMMAVLDFLSSGINAFRKEGGFKDLAEKTAALINTAFADPEKWTKIGNALRDLLKGSLEFLLKLEGLIKWTEIGTEVHRLVKRAIDDQELWSDLGEALEKWCKGIVDFINAAWPSEEEWYRIGHRISELLQKVPWASVFGAVIRAIVVAAKGLWDGLGDTFAGRIVRGIIAFKLSYGLLSPFFSGIGDIIKGELTKRLIGNRVSSMLGTALTNGATTAAGEVAGNAGLKAFTGAIGSAVGLAFGITKAVDLSKFFQGVSEQARGLNGLLTEVGTTVQNVADTAMQNSGPIASMTDEQRTKLLGLIDDLENTGATSGEMATAVAGLLTQFGYTSAEIDALWTASSNGVNMTTGQIAFWKSVVSQMPATVQQANSQIDLSNINTANTVGTLQDAWLGVRGQLGLTEIQWNSLDSAIWNSIGTSANAQEAYDLLKVKCEEVGIPVSVLDTLFGTAFPEAVKTGTDSAKSSLSSLATEGSASMSTLERTAGDSATRLRTKQTQEMKQAHTEGSREMQELQKDATTSTGQMEKDVSTNMESSKSSVSTNTGEMKAVSYENLKGQMADVQFFLSRMEFNFGNAWSKIARDVKETAMPSLKEAVGTGMMDVLTVITGFVGRIAGAFEGLSDTLYDVGYAAIGGLNRGLSQHVDLPHIYKQGDDRYYYGDGSWFDIPYFDVRWYAKGGMFTQPTLAGFGEAGDEAALPLENKAVMARIASAIVDASPTGMGSKDIVNGVQSGVYQAVVDAIQTGNGLGGNNPTIINVNIDGEKFTQYTIDRINTQTERNGVSPLIY